MYKNFFCELVKTWNLIVFQHAAASLLTISKHLHYKKICKQVNKIFS